MDGSCRELVCPWCERQHRRPPAQDAGVVRIACAWCREAFAAERVDERDVANRAGGRGRAGQEPAGERSQRGKTQVTRR